MSRKKREIISILLAALLLLALLLGAGWALLPKVYLSGTDWQRYRLEPEDSVDVFYVGSSMVYCDVIPAAAYEQTGLTGYVIGGPEQTIPLAYYAILQGLETQSPRAVALELDGMFFTAAEQHAPENLAFMPRGRIRLEGTLRAVQREDVPGLLLPVLAYHDRWNSLTIGELRDKLSPEPDPWRGYMLYTEAQPQTAFSERTGDTAGYAEALTYLGKIAALCRERDIALYLYLAPCTDRLDADTRALLERDAAALGAPLRDFSAPEEMEAMGLDMQTDFLDALHLNRSGAEKFSRALGDRLAP